MRLFIAIDLPDEHKKALATLRSDIDGARWVPADQIHLTLAFLGEVNENKAKLLVEKLKLIRADTFSLALAGTGCFPNRRHPKVLWVGIEPEPALNMLALKIKSSVQSCGIPLEDRPFSPHLTLARLKIPAARPLDEFFDKKLEQHLSAFAVSKFILFQSRLSKEGALHVPVASFHLAPHVPTSGGPS